MARASKNSKRTDLERLKRILVQRVERSKTELQKAEEELRAVTTTMRLLGAKRPKDEMRLSKSDYKGFEGLTQVQALAKLAQESGNNRFKLREAKKILFEAGLVKSKKNAGTILFTAIQRSGKFKRVAPGEYELLPMTIKITSRGVKSVPATVSA